VETATFTPELIVRAVLELLFLVTVLGLIVVFSRFRRRLRPLGAGVIVVVFVFFGAWGAAQMLDRWQYDYPQGVSAVPLTRFAMYQVQIAESVRDSYAWQVVTPEGDVVDVNIAREFEAIGLPPLSTRMRTLLDGAQSDVGTAEYTEAEYQLSLYARGLIARLDVGVAEVRFLELTGTPAQPQERVMLSWTAAELAEDAVAP
jgi:hypothetical protein